MGYIPPRPGIASGLYGEKPPKFIKLDHGWAYKNQKKIMLDWKSKFMMKEAPDAKKAGDEKEKSGG
jgi:hypothetical protein